MYKFQTEHQISFMDFNQSCGMQLDPSNEWVRLADRIPWDAMEQRYAELFPSPTGRPAKPFRMAFAALIIQKRKNLSDRHLVREIMENPYLQYFLGLHAFQRERPFRDTALVGFRKRLGYEFMVEANEILLRTLGKEDESGKNKREEATDESGNEGTAILDATCSPSNRGRSRGHTAGWHGRTTWRWRRRRSVLPTKSVPLSASSSDTSGGISVTWRSTWGKGTPSRIGSSIST